MRGESRLWAAGSIANVGCVGLVAVSCAGTDSCIGLHCDVPFMRLGVLRDDALQGGARPWTRALICTPVCPVLCMPDWYDQLRAPGFRVAWPDLPGMLLPGIAHRSACRIVAGMYEFTLPSSCVHCRAQFFPESQEAARIRFAPALAYGGGWIKP